MKIHQDGVDATTMTPSRKAVSFREMEGIRRPGRTPLRDSNGRTPLKSPHSSIYNGSKSTLLTSPSSTKKTRVNSNSFRQGLKKGCTPSSVKSKSQTTSQYANENVIEPTQQSQQYQLNTGPLPKTPSGASALRRTLRSTIQPQEKQHTTKNTQPQKKITLKTTSNISAQNEPFQSMATAMAYSSSYATSSLAGRSRLLGKGGMAPGRSVTSGLGPPARVVPKTPNTLLRTELEDEDEIDESFLLSPPPGALWNALKLSSASGDKRRTMSPTITTGLIVVSPQAAEEIHSWSSTKKQLQPSESIKNGVSPAVPRALLQSPQAVTAATIPDPKPLHIRKSPTSRQSDGDKNDKLKSKTSITEEPSRSIKDESVSAVSCVQNTDSSVKNDGFNSKAADLLQKSVEKSTKGGIAMDMTGFFCLEDSKPQNKDTKKWVESEPLSSSMPAALLSRLNSNRPVSSKKTKNTETKVSTIEPKQSLSATQKNARETKASAKRSSSIPKMKTHTKKPNTSNRTKNMLNDRNAKKIAAKSTKPMSNIQSKKRVTSIDESEKPKVMDMGKQKERQVSKMNKPSVKSKKADVVKPWKKHAIKQSKNNTKIKEDESKSNENSIAPPEQYKAIEKTHRGGLAFDVGFGNFDSDKPSIQNSTNQPRLAKKSSAIIKAKDSSDSNSWADKQCDVFVGWLNYAINPEEMDLNNEGCVASGLRALIIHRRLAEGRVNAFNLFKGDSMRQIRTTIVKEIAKGRLSIRSDRDISVDVHLRKKITSLLLSYTTPWLRMALEVMFGECIEPVPISENSPKTYLGRMKLSLEYFIKRRFLSDDNTLQKFTKGRCNIPSGKFESRYKEQMRNLVLSRIMTLVFFLDRAKASNVLENVPRLFTISSNVKSTRDVLITICRECLSAEGDIVKHLSRIGLKISYIQDPIDEVNFRVTNLATGLRDGVILTRLSEIITDKPFKSYMSSLRLPAVSRLQKKFNVNLAFSVMKDFGIVISEGINAHHVMDGHREMVLALMWCIISHSCLEKLLKPEKVEKEIQNVIQSSEARKKIVGPSSVHFENDAPATEFKSVLEPSDSANIVLEDLLLRWSRAVCSSFGMPVNDLSHSFSDGKAICLLIHYYHPSLISIDEIYLGDESSNHHESGSGFGMAEEAIAKQRLNWRKASKAMRELGGIPDMIPICDSQNPPNGKAMLLCLSYLCSRLMESSQEIFATILIQACYKKYREKVLMEKKMKAASSIFRIWNLYKDNYFRHQEQRFKVSVAVLENFVLSHKHALQRMKRARLKKERLIRSVTTIQRVFRGRLGRAICGQLRQEQMAANVIQRNFRRYATTQVTKELRLQRDSAIAIQSCFRRFVEQENFLDYRYYITEMQRCFRGYIARKHLKTKDHAALVIQQAWWAFVANTEMEVAAIFVQKIWRGVLGRRKSIEHATRRDAATNIQKAWRGYYQSLLYSITVHSSVVIQKEIRGYLSRKIISLNRYRQAANSIQKVWRGFSTQVQYQIDILDIVCTQSIARRFLSKRYYERKKNALSIIQCAYRVSIARHKLAVKRQERRIEELRSRSAVIIQAHVRGLIARQNICVLHISAYTIQNQWRKLLRYRLLTSSATKIQSVYRSMNCRNDFLQSKKAVLNIQRSWRGFASRQSNQLKSFAATVIQSAWRRYWAYSDYTIYKKEQKAATLIQAHARRLAIVRMLSIFNSHARTIHRAWLKYKQFKLENNAAIRIQAQYRCKSLRLQFLSFKSAIIAIQQIARVRQARRVLILKQKHRLQEQSAITLQKIWRGFAMQVQFQIDMMDIICVQSISRRYLVQKAYKRNTIAVSVIQRAFRCATARRERTSRKRLLAASAIQRAFRCATARRERALRKLVLDTMVLESSIKIQSFVRCFLSRTRYHQLQGASVCVQRYWRGSASRHRLSINQRAAIVIQSCWRRSFAQNNYLLDLLEMKSATLIQASFRMYMNRIDYMVVKYSAQTIQRFTRGLLSRVDLEVKHFAATEIQRMWRGYRTCTAKTMVLALIKIQSMFRVVLAKKKVDALRLSRWAEMRNRNKNASVIQISFRKYKLHKERQNAARIIQSAYRFHSELKRIQRAHRGVINLQARFRGGQVRKKRGKRLCELAMKIKEETTRALLDPTLRLGYRTSRALEILQTSQSLTKIMDAVKELEASTRLSVVCCQVFTKVNAANILLYLIQSCNRSVPHMELKEHILLTLENVAQYPSLVGSFAHYKYAEVFLDNIQVFRDKDGIFCLAVMLLGRITKADKDVAQFCATHEHLKRLKEVYRVASRRRIKVKNKVLSKKIIRLRKCGLAKRDDFDRKAATRLLREMIDGFSEIEVPHITPTPTAQVKRFDWNELQYSPLI